MVDDNGQKPSQKGRRGGTGRPADLSSYLPILAEKMRALDISRPAQLRERMLMLASVSGDPNIRDIKISPTEIGRALRGEQVYRPGQDIKANHILELMCEVLDVTPWDAFAYELPKDTVETKGRFKIENMTQAGMLNDAFGQWGKIAAADPEDRLAEVEMIADVQDAMAATLNQKKREAVDLRFGFNGPEHTLRALAKKFDMTVEGARQRLEQAFNNIRESHPELGLYYDERDLPEPVEEVVLTPEEQAAIDAEMLRMDTQAESRAWLAENKDVTPRAKVGQYINTGASAHAVRVASHEWIAKTGHRAVVPGESNPFNTAKGLLERQDSASAKKWLDRYADISTYKEAADAGLDVFISRKEETFFAGRHAVAVQMARWIVRHGSSVSLSQENTPEFG